MPTQLQFRRGSSSQNDLFTGAAGEISIDTTNKTIRVHDGSTAGGSTLANTIHTQLSNPLFTGVVGITDSIVFNDAGQLYFDFANNSISSNANFYANSIYGTLVTSNQPNITANNTNNLGGAAATYFASNTNLNSLNATIYATFTSNGWVTATFSSNAFNQATYASNAYTSSTYVSNAFYNSLLSNDVYDLDDISRYVNGNTNQFNLTFNGNTVSVANPYRLNVQIDGVTQPGFILNYGYVFPSYILSAFTGYTIAGNSNNQIKFSEPLPLYSKVQIRTVAGTTNQTTSYIKYPFKPLDLVMSLL